MKSEPTEKPRRKKTVVSETADRKNSRSLEPGHDEWWERLMMEPGPGESAGTDASVTESMIRKYSINSLVYWVTYVHNVVY